MFFVQLRIALDEADKINMGFQEDIDRILSETPATRNTWLFWPPCLPYCAPLSFPGI